MTDQERFEEWWMSQTVADRDYAEAHCYSDLLKETFLAALAIGREEGRKERTVEMAGRCQPNDYGCFYITEKEIYAAYPECFEKGEGK